MTALATAGVALAWLGATLVALSEARRGLALGLALAGLGLGLAVDMSQGLVAAGGLALAGLVSGLLNLRDGPSGWGLLPPGSTPRVVLSALALAASVLVGGAFQGGPGAAARVAALAAGSIAGVRLLTAGGRFEALGAASTLALAFGGLGTAGAAVAGSAVAVAVGTLRSVGRRGTHP